MYGDARGEQMEFLHIRTQNGRREKGHKKAQKTVDIFFREAYTEPILANNNNLRKEAAK